jgi:hypothetical protein
MADSVRWFVSLTMTLVFHGFSWSGQCIDRRDALHVIAECDEMVRSAHHDIGFLWSGQCIHQRDALHRTLVRRKSNEKTMSC